MIRIQKVERENCLGTELQGRVPTNAQELSIVFEETVFGAFAETEADSVITGKVDNEYLLGFRGGGAASAGVSKVNGQTETRKSYTPEKAVFPHLREYRCCGRDIDNLPGRT